MRITRLPQDNARTQGAARRAWYRRNSPQHLRQVAHFVNEAVARRASNGKGATVILGAGACTELPLEWIAARCSDVMLVDVDTRGMASARDELPARLRARVNLVGADLAGAVSQALEHELRSQPWPELVRLGGANWHGLLDAATLCLERCPIPDPPHIPGLSPHGYDTVISDLTLTQLFSLPLLDVVDTLMLYSPTAADLRETRPGYVAAAQHFRRRLALAHLSLMWSLARPGGSALLLTDVCGYLLPATSGPHAGERETLDVLPSSALDLAEDMGARFDDVEVSPSWRWIVSAPTDTMPGRAYDVRGVIGRARDAGAR